jgi:Spy/CpxP family protein refolding chaperone
MDETQIGHRFGNESPDCGTHLGTAPGCNRAGARHLSVTIQFKPMMSRSSRKLSSGNEWSRINAAPGRPRGASNLSARCNIPAARSVVIGVMKTSKWLVMTLAAAMAAGGVTLVRARALEAGAGGLGRGRFLAQAKEKLGLSNDQVSQIKGQLGADREQLTKLLTAWHDARVGLREVIQKPGAPEADIRAASAKVAAVEADLAVERARLYGRISPVLTADQLAKVGEFQQRVDDLVDGAIAVFGKRLAE